MDKKELQENILQAEYNRSEWITVLRNWFGAKQISQIPRKIERNTKDWSEYVENAHELGKLSTDNGEREVGIYEVRLTEKPEIEINRVKLRSLLNDIYSNVDGALIVFIQNEKWRFSYVSEIRIRDENDVVVLLKTEPKRYTYLFGEGENCRTAADRFDKLKGKPLTLDDLIDAFSVEKLSKDFFKTYKDFFEKFWHHLSRNEEYFQTLTKDEIDENKKPKLVRDFVKVLMGRLVFLQFLQKKGWMAVPANRQDWQGGDRVYIQNLFKNFSDKNHFHSKVLRTLFFETLNRQRPQDLAPEILGKNIKIPFLNGGLFESDKSAEYDFEFPPEYFRELLDFFERYNFTIDESDPFDREVGIDPQMLGHIFENLLEENREKGAFYTPKEIVHYMCQESLIEYLSNNLSGADRPDIESLVRHNIVSESLQNDRQKAVAVNDLLKRVKICDPAIGSGAFPMGLLKEIFACRRLLFAPMREENFNAAEIKKEIIQNNIYGVDVESGAVDIARLRFWLSLVVDEEEPQPLPNLDYKIMQGDSLLERFDDIDLKFDKSKLMSDYEPEKDLFGDYKNPRISINDFLRVQQQFDEDFNISDLEEKFFNTDNPTEKKNIREKIERLEKRFIKETLKKREIEISAMIEKKKAEIEDKAKTFAQGEQREKFRQREYTRRAKNSKSLSDLESEYVSILRNKELFPKIKIGNKPYFLWHLYYLDVFEKGGFDIVIGNPPYIQLQKLGEYADKLAKADFATFLRTGDIYCLFHEQSFDILKNGGTICFITSSQWLRAAYGKSLRKYLLMQNPLRIINLGPGVFASATVDTNILIAQKSAFADKLEGTSINGKDEFESLSENSFIPMNIDEHAWIIVEQNQKIINDAIERQGKALGDWDIEIYRGVVTGYNDAFLIDEEEKNSLIDKDSKSSELIKPLLKGRDLQRYKSDWSNSYILFIPWHFPLQKDNSIQGASSIAEIEFSKQYPAVYSHLLKHKSGLLNRNKEETGIRYEWYALQRCAATYYEEFFENKIIWKRIGSIMRFSYSENQEICLDSTCIATGEKIKYLTALLNSRISLYQLFESAPKTGMGDMIISVQALEPLLVYYPTAEQENYFNILVDYLLFLYDKNKPQVNKNTDNKTIGANFEEVINMMAYELYFEEHMKEKEIDVFQFFDFEDISDLENDEEKARIIDRAFKKFQERQNPIRNRILISESRSQDIIRYINQNTY